LSAGPVVVRRVGRLTAGGDIIETCPPQPGARQGSPTRPTATGAAPEFRLCLKCR
jgi:hypothetical protein